jgi:hypothetical protein
VGFGRAENIRLFMPIAASLLRMRKSAKNLFLGEKKFAAKGGPEKFKCFFGLA